MTSDAGASRLQGPIHLAPVLLVIAYGALLISTAWICDDAYITFRTVENFVHGHGLRYNVVERVQSYTHPLWMLLLCVGRLVFGDLYHAGMFLSLGASLLTVVWIVRSPAVTDAGAMIGVMILTLSRAYVDYSTSGLENPLTHLLLVVFLDKATRARAATETKEEVTLWGLIALCLVNRMDSVLLFFPWMTHATWTSVRQRKLGGVVPIAIGLLPFVVWELFSIVYYGFPFPNTAYAKLGAGLPRLEMMSQGVRYVGNSVIVDPLTPVAIAVALIIGGGSRNVRLRLFAGGVLCHLSYIVYIGGDFMSGRLLTAPLLVSVWVWTQALGRFKRLQIPAAALVLVLGFMARPPVFRKEMYLTESDIFEMPQVANERAFYYRFTGLLRPSADVEKLSFVVEGRKVRRRGEKVLISGPIGLQGFIVGPEVHVVDTFGLVDPLLSRLPMKKASYFRIGHVQREFPRGYEETLKTGRNSIENKKLRAYYARLSMIVRGPLFTAARFRTILRMNVGTFDHLLPRQ